MKLKMPQIKNQHYIYHTSKPQIPAYQEITVNQTDKKLNQRSNNISQYFHASRIRSRWKEISTNRDSRTLNK